MTLLGGGGVEREGENIHVMKECSGINRAVHEAAVYVRMDALRAAWAKECFLV